VLQAVPEERGMTKRTLTGWPGALRGIAVGLLWTHLASGQGAALDAGEPGDCARSPEPHECAERCPSFDTCYVEDDAQLYYRVERERFECDGLDCTAASTRLGDYCCQRGEYAPSRGGGSGGCALTSPVPSEHAARSTALGACLGVLGLLLVSRRARAFR
jgi:hypothetical protein